MKPNDLRYQLGRAFQAVQRRRLARRVESIAEEIMNEWDQPAFIDRFRGFWNPFPTLEAAKFLDLNVWFREAVYRYLRVVDHAQGRKVRVLDIGSGTGYFLLACRYHGHDVLGLDLDDEPLYNACFEFFDLPRVVHRIEPGQHLPDLSEPFDLVTAFMTSFNQYEDETPWKTEAWQFFLEDLRSRVRDEGRVVIKFNLNPKTGEFYPREFRRWIAACKLFRPRFFADCLTLVAC